LLGNGTRVNSIKLLFIDKNFRTIIY
jgi:hypothetical protein